jgi:hypothetical protein
LANSENDRKSTAFQVSPVASARANQLSSARFLTTIVFLALALFTIFTAQNCAPASSGSKNNGTPSISQGGGSDGGFDGKTYASIGDCGSGTSKDVKSRIGFSRDGANAALLRDNCKDVTAPVALDLKKLIISAFSSGTIAFNNLVYDLETSAGSAPVITNIFCKGTDFEIAVWALAAAPSSYVGHVTHNDHTSTGDLPLAHTQSTLAGVSRDDFSYGSIAGTPHLIFDMYNSPLGLSFYSAFQTTTGTAEGGTLNCSTQGH